MEKRIRSRSQTHVVRNVDTPASANVWLCKVILMQEGKMSYLHFSSYWQSTGKARKNRFSHVWCDVDDALWLLVCSGNKTYAEGRHQHIFGARGGLCIRDLLDQRHQLPQARQRRLSEGYNCVPVGRTRCIRNMVVVVASFSHKFHQSWEMGLNPLCFVFVSVLCIPSQVISFLMVLVYLSLDQHPFWIVFIRLWIVVLHVVD